MGYDVKFLNVKTLVFASAALLLSGCQKSDLEKCVDAQMAAVEEIHPLFSKEELEVKKKEWRANFYTLCSK